MPISQSIQILQLPENANFPVIAFQVMDLNKSDLFNMGRVN